MKDNAKSRVTLMRSESEPRARKKDTVKYDIHKNTATQIGEIKAVLDATLKRYFGNDWYSIRAASAVIGYRAGSIRLNGND